MRTLRNASITSGRVGFAYACCSISAGRVTPDSEHRVLPTSNLHGDLEPSGWPRWSFRLPVIRPKKSWPKSACRRTIAAHRQNNWRAPCRNVVTRAGKLSAMPGHANAGWRQPDVQRLPACQNCNADPRSGLTLRNRNRRASTAVRRPKHRATAAGSSLRIVPDDAWPPRTSSTARTPAWDRPSQQHRAAPAGGSSSPPPRPQASPRRPAYCPS